MNSFEWNYPPLPLSEACFCLPSNKCNAAVIVDVLLDFSSALTHVSLLPLHFPPVIPLNVQISGAVSGPDDSREQRECSTGDGVKLQKWGKVKVRGRALTRLLSTDLQPEGCRAPLALIAAEGFSKARTDGFISGTGGEAAGEIRLGYEKFMIVISSIQKMQIFGEEGSWDTAPSRRCCQIHFIHHL